MEAYDLLERSFVLGMVVFDHPFVVQSVCRRWVRRERRIHLPLVDDAVFPEVGLLDRGPA